MAHFIRKQQADKIYDILNPVLSLLYTAQESALFYHLFSASFTGRHSHRDYVSPNLHRLWKSEVLVYSEIKPKESLPF